MPQLEHIEAIEKRLWTAADTLLQRYDLFEITLEPFAQGGRFRLCPGDEQPLIHLVLGRTRPSLGRSLGIKGFGLQERVAFFRARACHW